MCTFNINKIINVTLRHIVWQHIYIASFKCYRGNTRAWSGKGKHKRIKKPDNCY